MIYDPNNSVFEAEQQPGIGHYNNVPNPIPPGSRHISTSSNNPVMMMNMTTPLPQMSGAGGQGDPGTGGGYNGPMPRASFDQDADEHQRQQQQLMLMQQQQGSMGDQPPAMLRPKSSMSGHQSRGSFLFFLFSNLLYSQPLPIL